MKDGENRIHPLIEQQAEILRHDFSVQKKSGAIIGLLGVREVLKTQGRKAYLLHEVYSNASESISRAMDDVDLPGEVVFLPKSKNCLPHLITERPVVRTSLYYNRSPKTEDSPSQNRTRILRAICCETGENDSLRFFQYKMTQHLTELTAVRTISAVDWMNRPYLVYSAVEALFMRHIQGRIYNGPIK